MNSIAASTALEGAGLGEALSAQSRDAFWRSLQTLNATRVVVGAVLLLYFGVNEKGYAAALALTYGQACVAYLIVGVAFSVVTVHYRRHFLLQLVTQIALDLSIISVLYITGGGGKSGLAILYLLPLAGSAILAPLHLALFFVSLVTLFLLAESTYQALLTAIDTPILQAGLYGAAFFATVLMVSRMAAKLIGQEELAARRGADLAAQQAINRLVMAAVGDGVLVIDGTAQVHTINPAAQTMLGLPSGTTTWRLVDIAPLAPIAEAFFAWRADAGRDAGGGNADAVYVTLAPGDMALPAPLASWRGRRDVVAHLKLRFASVGFDSAAGAMTVIFLQDVTDIENQAQQLKLASMGRLTASIAHEVRNPLAAIGHAGALLAEEVADPGQQRMLRIIGDNVARVNLMIEDILRLSRMAHGELLDLREFVGGLAREFEETHALADGLLVCECSPAEGSALQARFDPLHLRQIVVNLLSNAVRYASGDPGSVRLLLVQDAGLPAALPPELHVLDDGPGIPADVRAHLFEPFYTTSSKGTGLGLYLARELSLNNGALL
ncbi:MAG TPA: ATP-binding protein, partial [Burkholderiaceae bacterium]